MSCEHVLPASGFGTNFDPKTAQASKFHFNDLQALLYRFAQNRQ